MAIRQSLSSRPWALFAAIVGFAMLAVYLTLIFSEGDNDVWAIVPWAGLMAMGPILAFIAGIVTADRDARILLIASAALSFGVGVLAILSIGIGFLVAGAIALYGASQLRTRG